MNVDEPLIERIVANVMQQLMTADPVRSRNDSPAAVQGDRTSGSSSIPTITRLDEKVITEAVLEQHWNGEKAIQIGPRSILTPTARDFLRTRQIEWRRVVAPTSTTKPSALWKAVIVQATPAATQAVEDLVRGNGTAWKRELAGSLDEAVATATSAICRGEAVGVVVLSAAAAAVACRANRNRQVRAAVVTEASDLAAICQDVGCNVLVIDPGSKSYFELKSLLQRYAQNGVPQAPPGWDGTMTT